MKKATPKKSKAEIRDKKKEFAKKYAAKDPAALGRLAAAQRAHLYTPNLDHRVVLPYWESLLNEYVEKYKSERNVEDFIKDCETIKQKMNDKYGKFFKNGGEPDGFEDGFRLAHAQKSLSIALKHLWCREELSEKNHKYYPPVCPIDGIILKKAGSGESWTKVNHVERHNGVPAADKPVYKEHLALVREKACKDGYDNLSVWELFLWPIRRGDFGRKKKQGPSASAKTRTKAPLEQEIPEGGKIPYHHNCYVLGGWHIVNDTDEYYLFSAQSLSQKKLYCEVYSKKGEYSDSLRERIGTDMEYDMCKTPYYVYYFNDPLDVPGAMRLLKELKDRLC
jgi:hypothetical protein